MIYPMHIQPHQQKQIFSPSSSFKTLFSPFSPEVPVNDDPGDTQEQEHKPPPVRAPEAYNHHRAETEKYFIQRKLVILF